MMINDPIVEEIHQIRREMMAECDGDLKRLVARLRERETEDASRVVSSVEEGQTQFLWEAVGLDEELRVEAEDPVSPD